MKRFRDLMLLHCLTLALISGSITPSGAEESFSFVARRDYMVEFAGVLSVTSGDLNGDGIPDLITGREGAYPELATDVVVMMGNGDGTFGEAVLYRAGSGLPTLAVDDLDGDGHSDVVSANNWSDDVSILLNSGDGTLLPAVEYGIGSSPSSVEIGDLDMDGAPDLVVARRNAVSILLGNGNGTFQAAVTIEINGTRSVALGDLDDDTVPDLAVINYGSVSLLKGNGDGSFQNVGDYPIWMSPQTVSIGDLNSDAIPDLAVASEGDTYYSTDGYVSVLLGKGSGVFAEAVTYWAGVHPTSVALGDLDEDGNPDLAVSSGAFGWDWYDTVYVLIGHGDGTFGEGVEWIVGNGPKTVILDDLNGDEDLDLVTANYPSGTVSVLLGDGEGAFNIESRLDAGHDARAAGGGDLNRDGNLDLVLANYESDDLSILLGNGDGTFQNPVHYPAGVSPESVAVGDLNNDGVPDVVVTSDWGEVRVMLGLGDGTFQDALVTSTSEVPGSLALADLNGDGRLDLTMTLYLSATEDGSVSVQLGNGDGTFQEAALYTIGRVPRSTAIGDLDGDGAPDLVAVNGFSDDFSVLLGNGDGTFRDGVNHGTIDYPEDVAIGDLNGDGRADLALSHIGNTHSSISVLQGNGDGTFQDALEYISGYDGRNLAIVDLGGNGIADLVVTSIEDNTVTILPGNGDGTFGTAVRFGTGRWPEALVVGDLDNDLDMDVLVMNRGRQSSGEDSSLSVLINPTGVEDMIVVGPGPGWSNPPLVRVFPIVPEAGHLLEFPAYGPPHFGVNVTCGDLDGDSLVEILTGAGPGVVFGPHVRGFEATGVPLAGLSFLAYGTHKFGVNVAAGDLDGDGYDEVITGAGPGEVFGPHVRAFDYDGTPGVAPVPGVSYLAYTTPKWGVNVAAGDLDGDGFDEIVTGAGPGAVYGPHVRGWNVDGGLAVSMSTVSFLAYGTNRNGVNVDCGDVDGDGIDEIVTAPGPSWYFGPHIRGWNCDGASVTPLPALSFLAWPTSQARYGARVHSGADLDGDGRDEILVGAGPDPLIGSPVRVFTYDGQDVGLWITLDAYPAGFTHGVTVAAGSI